MYVVHLFQSLLIFILYIIFFYISTFFIIDQMNMFELPIFIHVSQLKPFLLGRRFTINEVLFVTV